MSRSRQIWSRLWGYVLLDRRYLLLALLCAAGVSVTDLLFIRVVQRVLDAMVSREQTYLTLFILAIVGIYALRWPLTFGQTYLFAEAGQRLGLRLRNAIYAHLQGLSLSFFNRQRTGALMSTVNNDVPILQGTVASLKDVASAPLTILGCLVFIVHTSWQLSLAAVLIMPMMVYAINRLTRLIRQITSRTQDKLSDVNTILEETLSGIRVIHSFSAEQHEIERFRRENQHAKDLYMSGVRQQAQLKPVIDLIGAAGVAATLWLGGRLIVSHDLTVGQLGLFVAALNKIATGINGLGSVKVTYEQVQAAGARILENVLDVQSDVQEAPEALALPSVQGRVEFRQVDFAYNAETPVLRHLSFTMQPGEVVAVVGPSGAGKSTVADLIPRFYDPQAGEVRIDGHDLRTVTLDSLRHHIGIVPQETVLFGGTIRENIAYGNPNASQEDIEAAARAANAHDFITNPAILPDGYGTLVGERGKQLSGGQRQRISIARALLKNPRILILDEATSSLDAESEKVVQNALETLMQGRTTLIIAHRLSTIEKAHKILVLQEGRIVESGTHADLLRLGGLYAQLYRRSRQEGTDGEDDPFDRSTVETPAAVAAPGRP